MTAQPRRVRRGNDVFAVIAGGGTAGHVAPALAIGEALVARGHDRRSIHFVGAKRGIDSRLVPPAGFTLTLLPGRGLARRLTLDNLGSLAGFAVALIRATVLLARLRPAVVVSMGGYAAAPCGLAAALLRIPLVLAEQNAIPTATHRLVARFAAASAVPYEGTPLPRAVVTGNPVRDDVLAQAARGDDARRDAREALGLPQHRRVVAAFGGSLGALSINEAVLGLAESWSHRTDVAVRHAIGERDWETLSSRASAIESTASAGLIYQALRYEDRMPEALAAADVVVSRSGGGTVAELAVVGRASVLVPLPIAPYDHQAANAQVLVRAGAALMLRDHECTAERLDTELASWLADPDRLEEMGRSALSVGHPDAAERVADVVEKHASRDA